jgi:hypothetical protein
MITLVAPASANLPRNATGFITKINPDGSFNLLMTLPDSTDPMPLTSIPHDYLRPFSILCESKSTSTLSAFKLLKSHSFALPTYQRRYAWRDDLWQGLWNDLEKPNHRMGTLVVYKKEGRMVVCDGQQRITTVMLVLAAARDLA